MNRQRIATILTCHNRRELTGDGNAGCDGLLQGQSASETVGGCSDYPDEAPGNHPFTQGPPLRPWWHLYPAIGPLVWMRTYVQALSA